MTIRLECPGCGAACVVAGDHVGKNVRCAQCNREFRAEAPDRSQAEPVRQGVRAEPGGPPPIPPPGRGDDRGLRDDEDYRRPPPRSSSSAWVWVIVLVCVLPFFACAGVIVLVFGAGLVSYFTLASPPASAPASSVATTSASADDTPAPDVAPPGDKDKAPLPAAENTMHVEALNDALIEKADPQAPARQRYYRLPDSADPKSLHTLDEAEDAIRQRRQKQPPLQMLVIVGPDESAPRVVRLRQWAAEQGLTVGVSVGGGQ